MISKKTYLKSSFAVFFILTIFQLSTVWGIDCSPKYSPSGQIKKIDVKDLTLNITVEDPRDDKEKYFFLWSMGWKSWDPDATKSNGGQKLFLTSKPKDIVKGALSDSFLNAGYKVTDQIEGIKLRFKLNKFLYTLDTWKNGPIGIADIALTVSVGKNGQSCFTKKFYDRSDKPFDAFHQIEDAEPVLSKCLSKIVEDVVMDGDLRLAILGTRQEIPLTAPKVPPTTPKVSSAIAQSPVNTDNSEQKQVSKPVIANVPTTAPPTTQPASQITPQISLHKAENGNDANLSELMIQMQSNDSATKGYAIQKITVLKAVPAIPLLIETMSDTRPLIRFGNPIRNLYTSPSELAVDALVYIGNPAEKPLIETLTSDHNYDIRAGAAKALGKMESHSAFDPLLAIASDQQRLLRDHPLEIYIRSWSGYENKPAEWKVRQQSILALGRIGDTNAVDTLLKLLEDEDQWIQAASVDSLSMIHLELGINGNKQEQEKLAARISIAFQHVLKKAIGNKQYIVEKEIAKDIRNFKTPEAANLMLMIIQQENPYPNKAGRTSLQDLTIHEWQEAQVAAVEKMGDIKDPNTVEPLIGFIKQKHALLIALQSGHWK